MIGRGVDFLFRTPGAELGVGEQVHPFGGGELFVELAGFLLGAVRGEEDGPGGADFVFSLLAFAVFDHGAEAAAMLSASTLNAILCTHFCTRYRARLG